MKSDVVGAVLAGGQSRRMGSDKALLAVGGVRLAARALEELDAVFAETIVVAGEGRDYSDLGYPEVRDRLAGCGPLAGLEAALAWAAPRPTFVLACDLPRVDRRIVRRVLEPGISARISVGEPQVARARVACRGSRMQPLCGLYDTACAEVAAHLLGRGERSVFQLLAAVELETVDFDDLESDPFFNVNTPADAARASGLVTVP